MLVAISKITPHCNPLEQPIWCNTTITREMVEKAISEGRYRSTPFPEFTEEPPEEHAARIAYLVKAGWEDEICIDVGIPCLGYNIDPLILDGHHRLAAAIYREDAQIGVSFQGQVDLYEELFDVKEEEEKQVDQKSCT